MKRTIRVTRIVEFELDIPDFKFSNNQISELVESKIDDYINEVLDEDWEFEGPEPKTIEQQPEPPEHCWIAIGDERWACNGDIAIAESCPIRPAAIAQSWLQATPGLLETINTRLLAADWRNMPTHTGIFDSDLAGGFRSLANLKAVGRPGSPAYLVWNDKLIAIVMPRHRRLMESDFHFRPIG